MNATNINVKRWRGYNLANLFTKQSFSNTLLVFKYVAEKTTPEIPKKIYTPNVPISISKLLIIKSEDSIFTNLS